MTFKSDMASHAYSVSVLASLTNQEMASYLIVSISKLLPIVICLVPLILANGQTASTDEPNQLVDDEEDFVPRFFGGRLNNEQYSGMAPPPRRVVVRHRSLSIGNVEIKTLTQKLDHFDASNKETWQQRYFANDAYFEPRKNGPIFIIIGGEESTFDEARLTSGPFVRLAEKYRGLVLALEHRYYGESRPTKDVSPKNLAYLSSRQSLEDLRNFIKLQKKLYKCKNPNPKFILYGCSYAGSLAAYFSMLYPESIAGAIAAFTPLLGIENFSAFFEGVGTAISMQQGRTKIDCTYAVINGIKGLSNLLEMRDDEKLNSMINLCEPKEIDYDNLNAIDSIFYETTSTIMSLAQFNKVFLGNRSELSQLCKIMATDLSGCSPNCAEWYGTDTTKGNYVPCCQLEKFSKYLNLTEDKCIRHDGKAIKSRATSWDADFVRSGTRQWLWQVCTEFGYFMTTEAAEALSELRMRINLNYLEKTCLDSFGISGQQIKANIARTNSFYASYLKESLPKKAFFIVSEMDPWNTAFVNATRTLYGRKYGAQSDWNGRVLKYTPHCYEPIGDISDPLEAKQAWEEIDTRIEKWLEK